MSTCPVGDTKTQIKAAPSPVFPSPPLHSTRVSGTSRSGSQVYKSPLRQVISEQFSPCYRWRKEGSGNRRLCWSRSAHPHTTLSPGMASLAFRQHSSNFLAATIKETFLETEAHWVTCEKSMWYDYSVTLSSFHCKSDYKAQKLEFKVWVSLWKDKHFLFICSWVIWNLSLTTCLEKRRRKPGLLDLNSEAFDLSEDCFFSVKKPQGFEWRPDLGSTKPNHSMSVRDPTFSTWSTWLPGQVPLACELNKANKSPGRYLHINHSLTFFSF